MKQILKEPVKTEVEVVQWPDYFGIKPNHPSTEVDIKSNQNKIEVGVGAELGKNHSAYISLIKQPLLPQNCDPDI